MYQKTVSQRNFGPATRAIHDGKPVDPQTGAVITPTVRATTFEQEAIGVYKHEYSRTDDPTRKTLEANLAALENGTYGFAYASGLAASASFFLGLFQSGDHVVVGDDTYGGTYRQLEKVFKKWGLQTSYVQVDKPQAYADAIQPNTRWIWAETPTNPLNKIISIRDLAAIAHARGIRLAVDNTFNSPYFQKPLDLGADLVAHSLTKYINGHSDVVGGALIVNDPTIAKEIAYYQNAIGAILGPDQSSLVLRGISTLPIRMEQHQRNALYLAPFLKNHPLVENVYYPGLKSDPYHELALTQQSGFNGMISFELRGGKPAVNTFISGLRHSGLIPLAESLGGVESLICYPPEMTHGSIPAEERARRGIKDNLLRLSVGNEDVADLQWALELGFAALAESNNP